MRKTFNGRGGFVGRSQKTFLLAAVAAIGLSHSAFGQLYFDTNGSTSGLGSGTFVWDLVTPEWQTTASPGTTAPEAWVKGSVADFDAADVVQVAPNSDIQLTGIRFDAGSGSAAVPNLTVSGTAGPWELDFGSNNLTITQNTTAKQFIAAPLVGTGNIIVNVIKAPTASDGSAVALSGNMSGFSGNIYLNNAESPAPSSFTMTNSATLHIDTAVSGGTIYLDQDAALYSTAGQVVGAGTAGDTWTATTGVSPLNYTIGDNIVLNYNGAAESEKAAVTNYIGNGGSATVNGTLYSKVVTYTGAISSPSGVTTNLVLGGQNTGGTIILDNQETYNGSTTVAMSASGNGFVSLGVNNALPVGSALIMGSGATGSSLDLGGNNQTVAGLTTGTTNSGATNIGNIYDLSVNNSSLNFSQNPNNNPSALTITPAASNASPDVYKGDLGDSSVSGVNPFLAAPYNGYTSANTDISLTVNGPASGTYSLELNPISGLASGNEYSGNTTINQNATLILARSSTYTPGSSPGNAYTVTGGGTVNVNSGATLASTATTFGGTSPTYVGGFAGVINLNSGSNLTPGGAGTIGLLVTGGAINFNGGAAMNFDLNSPSNSDEIIANGGLNLDSVSATHTINVSLATGASVVAGTYDLVLGNISGDDANTDGFTLNTSSITGTSDTFKLVDAGSALVLEVLAPVLRWDPSATYSNGGSGPVVEGGGTWTDGSPFVNLLATPYADVGWSNTAYANYDVQIGGDNTGDSLGGPITLGENITVGGKLRFAAMYPGYNYSIEGNGYSLTLNGGMVVATGAATTTTPSAQIDAPVILGADQTWEIDSGEVLNVTGSLTGAHALTVVGNYGTANGGILNLSASGLISQLNADGGIVVLGVTNAIGASTPITLNGGGVEFAVNGSPGNPITVGSNGGELGATSQSATSGPYNVIFANNITGGYALTAIGTGNSVFNGNISVSTFTSSSSTATGGGNITLNGANTMGALVVTSGTLTLAGTDTITAVAGTPTISVSGGATLIADSPAALSSSTTPMISLAPVTGTAGGVLSINGFTSLPNSIYLGTNGSASMTISDNVSGGGGLNISGAISGSGNLHLVGPEFTLSGNNTNTNSIDFETTGEIVHTASATALGTATISVDASSTLDVQTSDSARSIRSSTIAATLTKIGSGTLTITGSATTASVAGSLVDIQQGEIVMQNYQAIGGTSTSSVYLNLQVDSGATLAADFDSTSTRTGGSVTLNSGTVIHDASDPGDAYFGSASAADLWTINGNSTIEEAQNGVATQAVIRTDNPFLITTGSTLTLKSEDTTGNYADDALAISGPANLTAASPDPYQDFTIQSGATVVTTGPGAIRFGRTGSQGIAIIGEGSGTGTYTTATDAVMQLSNSTALTDLAATSQMFTTLVVAGSGNAGLRIEAPMDAAYSSANTGTTGLFGINSYNITNDNIYTVLSPNRAAALSSSYSDGTNTFTPGGTLTLAANDAGGATGVINVGPAAASSVSLALSNGTGSGGTLTYQINPGSTAGKNFANFAGLTVERQSTISTASVVAQLTSPTLIPALTIQGGAKMDITNQSLAIDSASTGPGTLAQVAGYLTTAFDNGNWDGPGIGSSYFTNGMAAQGTSIGYALNSTLATPFTSFGPVLDPVNNPGVQEYSVDGNAVLVAYTYLGDLNLDGRVDSSDAALMGVIPTSGPEKGVIGWFDGDLNYDGKINADDWSLFFLGDAAYTASGQSINSTVPEPAAASLLIAGAGMMLRRKRRAHPVSG